MRKSCTIAWLLIVGSMSFAGWGMGLAQELPTPSQKAKEAIEKFIQTPSTVGKKLQEVNQAAKSKLEQALGAKRGGGTSTESSDTSGQKAETPPAAGAAPSGKRDPFRPATLQTKITSQPRENLTPLERVEWGQINLVGIVWDSKEPRALVEVPEQGDKSRGYVVKIGNPIGTNEGRITAITRNEMVVEEFFTDFYGRKKKREVRKRLPTE